MLRLHSEIIHIVIFMIVSVKNMLSRWQGFFPTFKKTVEIIVWLRIKLLFHIYFVLYCDGLLGNTITQVSIIIRNFHD